MLTALVLLVGAFEPGQICDGLALNNGSDVLLRGRHLIVCEVNSPPLAMSKSWTDEHGDYSAGPGRNVLDPTTKDGWSGLDIDLLEEISTELGFTYEIQERAAKNATEDWNDVLYQITPTCDVVGTYWTHTPKRRERVLFMTGHIDYSSSLIVRAKTTGDAPMSEKLTTFLMPFSPLAWVLLALMTVLTGFVFFTVEATANRTAKGLRDSVYLSTAGMLWGDFQTPTTRVAIPFQIVVSFIVLIVVSACMRVRLRTGLRVRYLPPLRILRSHLNFVDTANLAAALTVSALTREPSSLDEMRAVHPEVCIRTDDVLRPLYSALFPSLRQAEYPDLDPLNPGAADDITVDQLKGDLKVQLAAKTCHAILAPSIIYRFWATQDSYMSCSTRVVEKPAVARAGYVSNLQSWCVARAFDIAIERMRLKGTIDRYTSEWYPPQPCEYPTGDTSRRQLAPKASKKGGSVGGAVTGDGNVEYGQVHGLSGIDQMDAVDFIGIFLVWGVASILTIIAALIKRRKKSGRMAMRKAAAIPAAVKAHTKALGVERTNLSQIMSDLKEPQPLPDVEGVGFSSDFVDGEVSPRPRRHHHRGSRRRAPPGTIQSSVARSTADAHADAGHTTFDASRASKRDAQQLISTLQDALATLKRKDTIDL